MEIEKKTGGILSEKRDQGGADMKHKQGKKKMLKTMVTKAAALLLTAGLAGGFGIPQPVQAESAAGNGVASEKVKSQESGIVENLIQNLLQKRPEYKAGDHFWWTNLDQEEERELIIQVYTQDYQEKLLVYDMKEENGEQVPYLVCETLPPVQIRYGFQEKTDASGKTVTVFTAVTGLSQGEVTEGRVTFNRDRTDLLYEEYIVDHDFVLGRDNFWFGHTCEAVDARSGFAGISRYEVSDVQKKALLKGENKGTKAAVKDKLEGEFGGACYGLANMMGLVKEGTLRVKDLDANAKTLYQVGKPSENRTLYQEICYCYLLQLVMESEDNDAFIPFEEIDNKDDRLKALEAFVKAVSSERWQILGYIAEMAVENEEEEEKKEYVGHALLVTGMEYVKEDDVYRIEFYDINSIPFVYVETEEQREENIAKQDQNGQFYSMCVKGDFSGFELTDANGHVIDQKNCTELCLISVNTIWKEKEKELKKAEKEKGSRAGALDGKTTSSTVNGLGCVLTFDASQGDFSYKADNHSQMVYKDGAITEHTKDMKLMQSLVQEGTDSSEKVYRRIQMPNAQEMSISCDPKRVDLSIQTEDGYYAVSGQGIEKIVCSPKEGIQLTGENMTFTTGLLMKEDPEHVLTKTDGAGSGTITIQEADGKLSVSSKKPVTVKRVRSIGDTQTVQYDVDQTAGQIVLAQDGSLTMKNGSASVWRILIPICGICGVLAVLVLMRSRRKRDS